MALRIPDIQFYFDLAELRGLHYHTGVVFSALVREHGQALALGGRYDDIGVLFGRARPATGFSIDLKALLGLLPPVTDVAAIFAPYDPSSSQWQFVQSLRESGEKVICGLPGQETDAACDRVISKVEEQWCVKPLN